MQDAAKCHDANDFRKGTAVGHGGRRTWSTDGGSDCLRIPLLKEMRIGYARRRLIGGWELRALDLPSPPPFSRHSSKSIER